MAVPTRNTFNLIRAQTDPTYEWFQEYNRDPQGFYERYFSGTPHPSSRWGQDANKTAIDNLPATLSDNPPGAGPSAGHSQGPNIGLTFPGYWLIPGLEDLDKKYADWREALRGEYGPDTTKHLDMEAFREHVKGIGAPDPGVPVTTPSPTEPDLPGVTKPGGTFAGQPLPTVNQEGTAADLFGRGINLGNLTTQDLQYYFPYAVDPSYAASNLLEQFGFNTGAGSSPYTRFLETRAEPLSQLNIIKSIMETGGGPNVGDITNQTAGQLQSGGGFGSQDLMKNIAALISKYKTSPEGVTPKQVELISALDDPTKAYNLVSDFSRASGGVSSSLIDSATRKNALSELYNEYRRSAASTPNKSFFNSITGF